MITLFFSILVIGVGFYVVSRQKKAQISTRSVCCICNQVFDETEVFVKDELVFCQDHYFTYINGEWVLLKEVSSTPENSVDGVNLYENKLRLFKNFQIPSVIKLQYKIEGEHIITTLQMFVLKKHLNKIKKDLIK